MNKYVALYSKKSLPNSDNKFYDESEGEILIVKRYISQSDKKPSGSRRFPPKFDSSASKGYVAGKKTIVEKKEGPKCSNSGGIDRFTREYKSKKVDANADYEVKYKKLLAPLM